MWRIRFADDSPVLAGRLVEPLELAVGDPDEPCGQVVERLQVALAEHRAPHRAERVERDGPDDPVVGAGLQVDGRAGGEVTRHLLARHRPGHQLLGEGGQDHIRHRRLQRAVDEPAAEGTRRELADAVGLHPRLFE